MKLIVDGMNCGHCVSSVTKAIQSINPEAKVDIDLKKKEVVINGDVALDAAIAAITDAGFDYVGKSE